MMNTTTTSVYHMPMRDIIGVWKTKDGKYDNMTYEFEIDNLNKFKIKYNRGD